MMQRILRLVVLLGSSLIVACSESAIAPSVPTELLVSFEQITLIIGDSALISAQVIDQNGAVIPTDSSTTILWSTDSPSIARVTRQDQDARLDAVSAGNATVTAKFASLSTAIIVDVVGASTVIVTPSSAQMVLNGGTTLTAEVRGPRGERIHPTVFWTSLDPTIASLAGPTGTSVGLTGLGLGSTTVIAEALGVADTITAQVVPDTRFLTAVLDIIGDTVMTDANAPPTRFPVVEYRAFDGLGNNVCHDVWLGLRADSSVITPEQERVDHCEIKIEPLGPGSTWLYASVNDVRDSVWVHVTDNRYFAEFIQEPDSTLMVAGQTVSYIVRVYDEGDNPVPGAAVNFNLDGAASDQPNVGNLSAKTVVTDASGNAPVDWTLPTDVAVFPSSTLELEFAVEVPNGNVESGAARPELLPDVTADFLFFTDEALTDTVTTLESQLGFLQIAFFVQAVDQFVNLVDTDIDEFSVTDPEVAEIRIEDTYPGFTTPASAQIIVTSGRTRTGSNSLAITQGPITESIAAPVLAGPTVVFTPTGADDRVFLSQIEIDPGVLFFGTTAYDGALPSHFPAFTSRRDTITFLLDDPVNDWGVFTASADGTEATAPNQVLTPDLHSTYAWGFPVFLTRTGTAGDVVFISDSLGLAAPNVYTYDRTTATATKVTNNTDANVIYRGLSLSLTETSVLITTDADAANGIASNVFEVDLTTGDATQLTSNTNLSQVSEYRSASYARTGSKIWIDRSGPEIERELLVRTAAAVFEKFIVDEGQTDLFQATFNPSDPTIVAWLDSGAVKFSSTTPGGVVIDGLANVKAFSWDRR